MLLKNKVFLVHTVKPTTIIFLRSNVDDEALDQLFKYWGVQCAIIPFGTTFKKLYTEKENKKYIIAFNEGEIGGVGDKASWSKGIELLELLFTYIANKQ